MAQAQVLCLERASRDPAAQTSGVSFVSDFEGWSYSNMRIVERGITRDYFRYVQNCLLALVKKTHIIRQPTSFNILYAFTRPFMSDEMVRTLCFHGRNLQLFHEDVPPGTLPREYEGTAPSTDWHVFWKNVSQERAVLGYAVVRERERDITGRNGDVCRQTSTCCSGGEEIKCPQNSNADR
ncbi:alpha-tocopherol transfer protein-like [Haemaphysalis longicornis]